jgi:DNA-directed RNA polymerase subunit E'/Rpb7
MSSKKSSIYSKNLIHRRISLPIHLIGSNLINIIQTKLSKKYEGQCSKEGYIKNGSIQIVTYSSGILKDDLIVFDVSFECLICRPVEGMRILCKIDNVTKAGIRASYYNQVESPITVFLARDHYANNPLFLKLVEGDFINIKVIGTRFELNDKNIYIIAELLRKIKSKKKKQKNKTQKNN